VTNALVADSRTKSRGRLLILVVAALIVAVSLGGCSAAAQPGSATAALTASDAWVRVTGSSAEPIAGYLTIVNHGSSDDALVGASSPGATSVALHQSSMDSSGMMGMQPVARLECPIGATVALAPGGYHLMISGLTHPLKVGDLLELDLVFEHGGTIVVQAQARQA
jgi:copper(I)-binding protein